VIERVFWFLFVAGGTLLFAFCADDVIATSNEVTKIPMTTSNNENARIGTIDFRMVRVSP
jgi:hypothetical protein